MIALLPLLTLLTLVVYTHIKICPFTIPLVRLLVEPNKTDIKVYLVALGDSRGPPLGLSYDHKIPRLNTKGT